MEKTIEAYDTSLALGLTYAGRSSSPSTDHHHLRTPYFKQEPWVSDQSPLAPSLTLGLSSDVYASTQMKITQIKASPEATPAGSSSPSIISSFSKSGSEEAERVLLSSRVSYKDQEKAGSAGKKLRLTREQSALLEDRFMENSKLNYKQKQALSKQLNLRPRQVEVWFQNRRARTKKKQSEVECQALRRYCEKLTNENRRLKKELRELKAINLASSPSHVQVPAGLTRTVCPSCERVSGEASKSDSFAAAPTKQKFNTFTRATAC